ncbi:hypothetical protein [Desulfoscipio gibsoniae]|uniref:DUF4179 domain-containing protein n=1 Tax=Desulfoscipio gibsoniae DSM 7213 TaxID=767817 RepID=R4KCT5_9FIRM|nr:hypothetical protein [Desulfoscipio gibsoniae]AGL00394.1 hypothetical protein Desgi_0844 [Desulfoscipio gibsoniae DSM 7213]
MNEDKMLTILNNLDDDLIEKEIDNLMDGVECNMESINKKAHKKLDKYNRKIKFRKQLPYVAAICACFICINTVYADDISEAVKRFFNKTPVYSTMVDGSAYYLKDSLVLDDNMVIDSFMVSEGRMDMKFTSKLGISILKDTRIIPKDNPNTQYVMGGYSEDNGKYTFSFMNGKEDNYNIKPFKSFDLIVGNKTYSISLDQAKSLDETQKLFASEATSNQIGLVDVGANSLEKDGKQAIQLIASFKNKDMKLSKFGRPVDSTVKTTFENLGEDGIVSTGTGLRTEDIYVTDESGTKYKLEVPADSNAFPVTTFVTDAAIDNKLTLKLPALIASYQKKVDSLKIIIPKEGEEILNRDVDMFAQKAVAKSIKRLSPTSAQLVFQLNTGNEKYVGIKSFHIDSKNILKASSEFSGDTAVMILEFNKDVDEINLDISWPKFVMNGNWTINMK